MNCFLTSKSEEWYTPLWLLCLVRGVFGGTIDFDPASSEAANRSVRALEFRTKEQDGLACRWRGNVFLNPPYGSSGNASTAGRWLLAALAKYEAGEIDGCLLLLKAAVGYRWFAQVYDYPCCFLYDRVHYESPSNNNSRARGNPHGSVLVYLGPDVGTFADVFSPFGAVMVPQRLRETHRDSS